MLLKDVIIVVDNGTADWLKSKSTQEKAEFGLSVARVVADDKLTEIQEWVRVYNRLPKITKSIGALNTDNAVKTVNQYFGNYSEFLTRSGSTKFGGRVYIILCY